MKKKGFTLIELLAVIIILAVIALIATPIVLNVVDNAKKEANKNSVYGLLDAAKLYYAESLLDKNQASNINGSTNVLDKIKVSGDKPDSGTVYINNVGQISIAVVYDDMCYKKGFQENDLSEGKKEECSNPIVDNTPVVSETVDTYSFSAKISTDIEFSSSIAVVYSDTPHFAILDSNGNFSVNDLEPGNHELYLIVEQELETLQEMEKDEILSMAMFSFEFNTNDTLEPYTYSDGYGNTYEISDFNLTKHSIPVINYNGIKLVDANKNNALDIGEEIKIGTESFYIISTNDKIKALAKYNLKVGKIIPDSMSSTDIETTELGYGLQDSTMIGYFDAEYDYETYPRLGTIWIQDYSATFDWGDNEDYDIQKYDNPVKTALNNYKTKLSELGVNCESIGLITKTELKSLGCTMYEDGVTENGSCSTSQYSWVYSTSYWTGSIVPNYVGNFLVMFSDGAYSMLAPYYSNYAGVRPVITLDKTLFQ